ncbi:MAG: adenine deaminase [Caldiserica bacterium]|nr:MAG: adenine deaminase [Caldisericota bacterium]
MEYWTKEVTKELIRAAKNEIKVDLLLKNVSLINVFSGEIKRENVAVHSGVIVGFGDYSAKRVIDLKGKYLSPGFIESHIHIESSLLGITEFAKAVVKHGTTTVIADPHEIANVLGLDGIKFMLEASKYQPISLYFELPSAVPATTDFETSGAKLSSEDLIPFSEQKWVVGLGEVMNYPDVFEIKDDVINKIELFKGKIVEGHAPALVGKYLSAYIVAGARSDHESFMLEEAKEKLEKGMIVMIREGSIARNLKALISLVNERNWSRFILVSDDLHPLTLQERGHLDYTLREAIKFGIEPVNAIRMVTLNPATYFGFKNLGAIAPGYWADMVVFSDFKDLKIERVFKKGVEVFSNGRFLWKKKPKKVFIRSSVNIKWLELKQFLIPAKGRRARVTKVIPGELITEEEITEVKTEKGYVVSDPENDILKLFVIERHSASGNIGKGLVKGIGLKKGAIAQTISHDSHNIVVCGVDDESLFEAVLEILKMGGGICCAVKGKVLSKLPLPIAGLMTDEKLDIVVSKYKELLESARKLGSKLDDPYMTLSFLALPVIPKLKLTDKGLVDVEKFKFVKLFV